MELYQPQLQFGGNIFEPGVYDISNDEYHASVGVSRSAISEFLKSPLHYWDRYINPDKPQFKTSKSFEIGTAVHMYLIERELFDATYKVLPIFSGKGSVAKKQEYLELNQDKQHITQKDLDTVLSIVNSIKKNELANILLSNAVYEKSIYWVDEDTGLLCKARPDIWHSNMIADLKTSECAKASKFQYSLGDYDYHIQAGMILDAVKKIALEDHMNYFFIVAETKRPYPSAVYELNEESIYQGRNEYKNTLIKMKECFETNVWPGYQDGEIGLSRFRLKI